MDSRDLDGRYSWDWVRANQPIRYFGVGMRRSYCPICREAFGTNKRNALAACASLRAAVWRHLRTKHPKQLS